MPRKGLPASIIKKYGVTKKAWAVFRGRKTPRSVKKEMPKRRRSSRRKVRASRRGAIGGLNIKGLLFGAGLLAAAKYAVGHLAPGLPYQKPISAIGAGAVAGISGLPGKRLVEYGLMDAGSDLALGFIGGGGGAVPALRGYDL